MTGNSGLDVTISNLTASTVYRFTVWSFDATSATNRASDWSANGVVVTNNYAFNFNYTRGRLTPNIVSLGAVVRTNVLAYFNGQIDDVAVFRRSLTSNEVQIILTSGPLPPPTFAQFTFISVVSSNVTLRYFNSTQYQFKIQETAEFAQPVSSSVWTDVTNAVITVNGDTVTAEFPQTPGPQRFYRLASE